MTKMVPNDKNERLKFLREMYIKNLEKNKLRERAKKESIAIKHRRLEKQYLHIKKLQNNNQLPHINIPLVKHTEEWGDLVFRIDKENETIRILQRIYQWDSDKDDINDE